MYDTYYHDVGDDLRHRREFPRQSSGELAQIDPIIARSPWLPADDEFNDRSRSDKPPIRIGLCRSSSLSAAAVTCHRYDRGRSPRSPAEFNIQNAQIARRFYRFHRAARVNIDTARYSHALILTRKLSQLVSQLAEFLAHCAENGICLRMRSTACSFQFSECVSPTLSATAEEQKHKRRSKKE